MRSHRDVIEFIQSQPQMMRLLEAVEGLSLPDCWIGAGFVRNAVWDALHGRIGGPVPRGDLDVTYFDPSRVDSDQDLRIEALLLAAHPDATWDVKNQARMHLRNGDLPYTCTLDALRHWPETATAVAVRSDAGRVELVAPHGINDLVEMVIRPTPAFLSKTGQFSDRLRDKNWTARWPMVRIMPPWRTS